MEIPQNIQDKLKCDECEALLSCGPVYLMHKTGGAICGRCSQEEPEPSEDSISDRTRNAAYEATASLLAFPCAFAHQGCPEKVKFSIGQQSHEANCKFRPFICPIVPKGSCDWIGSWSRLKEHCEENHESNILENNSNLPRPDLTASNLKTYLISAFHFLFLLQIKVCVRSGKLFHSLRMFGDQKFLDKFSFTLDVDGNNIKFSKRGSVICAGILIIQEPTAISTKINNLLGILDEQYNESNFRITIHTSLYFNCVNCLENIDYECNSKFCEQCKGTLVKCAFNENCSFLDVSSSYKIWQHKNMFCQFQKVCYYCKVQFTRDSFIEHLRCSTCYRKVIESNNDSVARVPPNFTSDYNFILFSNNNIGTVICESYLSHSKFYQYFYTPLASHELKNYKCSIELTDPQTKYTKILTPQFILNDYYDLYINETMNHFPSIIQNVGIDIKLNIDKL